jgi:hypothetical protein
LDNAVIIKQTTGDERRDLRERDWSRERADLKRLAFVLDIPMKHLDFTEPPAVV